MKRETTCYETNKLHTLKFISWCKIFINTYDQHKLMLLPDIAEHIWKMIQQDVFNVNNSDFDKLINDIGYRDFYWVMYDMCYKVKQKEEKYIYYIKFEDKNCISLIGEPIYEFMSRIEEMIPYED